MLEQTIYNVDPAKTNMKPTDLLLYCYYGGMIHIGEHTSLLYECQVSLGLYIDDVDMVCRTSAISRGIANILTRAYGSYICGELYHNSYVQEVCTCIPDTYW